MLKPVVLLNTFVVLKVYKNVKHFQDSLIKFKRTMFIWLRTFLINLILKSIATPKLLNGIVRDQGFYPTVTYCKSTMLN